MPGLPLARPKAVIRPSSTVFSVSGVAAFESCTTLCTTASRLLAR